MKISPPQRQQGVIALIGVTFFFACMGLFARYLNTGFHLFQQVYLRMLAGFLIGAVIFGKQVDYTKLKRISLKEWVLLIFRSAASSAFGVVLFTKAILITKYSNVSFIGAIPLSAIWGVILMKEKLTWPKALMLTLAFIGVTLIGVKDYTDLLDWGRGEILTLISAVMFTLSYVTRKWQTNLLSNQELTQINFALAVTMIFISSLLIGEGLPTQNWTWPLLGTVIVAGGANIANNFLINYSFERVEAILASNLLTLETFFAVILGFIFFREVPSLKEFLGGIVIVASVLGMNYIENKHK